MEAHSRYLMGLIAFRKNGRVNAGRTDSPRSFYSRSVAKWFFFIPLEPIRLKRERPAPARPVGGDALLLSQTPHHIRER